MPEIKNTFTSGRMNKDLDERLISKSEYRNALNIEISTSQDGNVGALQNSWGNTKFSEISDFIANATCVGSVVDKENDKLYWFIAGDEADAIAEYDYKTEQVLPVLVDSSIKETNVITFAGSEIIGSELVTSGSSLTTADWYLESGWTISGGIAYFNGQNYRYLGQLLNLTANTHYKISIAYKRTSGSHALLVSLGSNSPGWQGSAKLLDTNGGDNTTEFQDLGNGVEKQTFFLTTSDLQFLDYNLRIHPGSTGGGRFNGEIHEVSVKQVTYPDNFSFLDSELESWGNVIDDNANPTIDLSKRAWTIADGVLTANEFTAGYVTYQPEAEPFFEFIEGEEYEMQYEIVTQTEGGFDDANDWSDADDFVLHNAAVRGENVRLNPYSTGVKTISWVQGPSNLNKVVFYHTVGNSFSVDNISFKKVNRFLNFEANRFITAINILDGMLFWTDGFNEPKKINIQRCKSGSFSIINGNTSVFLGDELITNGTFTDNANDFILGANCATGIVDPTVGYIQYSNNAINWVDTSNNTNWTSIFQNDVDILRRQVYEVSFTVTNYVKGRIQAFISDQNGNPTTGPSVKANGTFTHQITAGTKASEIYNYTPKSAGLRLYSRHIYGSFVGTIDNFSIKKVQHAWKSTTQMKTHLEEFAGDIRSSDVTVIKKYPLTAPGMLMRNSSKGANAVIEANCTTPLNTTLSGSYHHWRGSDGDHNFGYVYTQLSQSPLNMSQVQSTSTYFDNESLQFDVNDMFYSSTGTGLNDITFHDDNVGFKLTDAANNNAGSYWTQGSINGIHDNVMTNSIHDSIAKLDADGRQTTPYANDAGYLGRAWKSWCAIQEYAHMWFTKHDQQATGQGFSSSMSRKNAIAGRFWMKVDHSNLFTYQNDVNGDYAKLNGEVDELTKLDKVSFGRWFSAYNNLTFWTYKDGDGNERVKPAGVSSLGPMIQSDGTKFRDEVGNTAGSPTVPRADDNFAANPAHFGDGWSASGTNYVGVAATTTSNFGGLYSVNTNANGHQYVQLVADDIDKGRPYTVSFKIVLTTESGTLSSSDAGVSARDHDNVIVDSILGSDDMRIQPELGVGTYHFSKNFTADASGGLQFFKRNNVECVISEISITTMYANPVVIQPLTFTPKPNFEVGDIIEMTNTKKDSKGEDIKVRVRLLNDYNDNGKLLSLPYHGAGGAPGKWHNEWGYGNTVEGFNMPKTFKDAWRGIRSDGSYVDMCNDSDFSQPAGEYFTLLGDIDDGSGGDLSGLKDTNNGSSAFIKRQTESPMRLIYGSVNPAATSYTVTPANGIAVDADAQVAAGASSSDFGNNYTDSNGNSVSSGIPPNTPAGELFHEGKYYMMKYTITGHTNSTHSTFPGNTDRSYMLLDSWQNGDTDTSGTALNSGRVSLPKDNGTHTFVWKWGTRKNDGSSSGGYRLQIKFSTAWIGQLDNLEFCQLDPKTEIWGGPGSNENRKVFDAEIVTIDKTLLQLSNIEKGNWNCKLYDKEPLFETVFPRFAYRWKYQDGEYSAMSPFTEVAFLPGNEYDYDSKKAYNLAMTNHVRKVILNSFQKPPKDVKELDILYKESHNTSIYTVTTIKGSELENFEKYEITQEQLHATVESKQLLRPYDNVPRKALAQEISANRLIYGNYTQQYTITPDEEPIIFSELSGAYIEPGTFGKTIKSLRNYQVGLSYVDEYGRQSPVFSNKQSLIDIPLMNASTANSIQARVVNFAPDWATHYKWYIKDSSESYYNIALDRFYQGEYDDHTWLSFPSSDFNKVHEEDYLILKKQHNKDSIILDPSRVLKYKIIKKQASSPDFLRLSRDRIGGRIKDATGDGLHFYSQSSYGGSAAGYPLVGKTTFRVKGSVVEAQGTISEDNAFKTALLDSQAGKYIRIGRENTSGVNSFSNYYEVLHVSRTNTNDTDFQDDEDFYEFTLVKPLDVDASFVGSGYSATKNLFLEYYGEGFNRYDGDFEGKFFCKILKDADFDSNVAAQQNSIDSSYNIVNASDTYWHKFGELAPNATKGVGNNDRNDIGQDTDIWLVDRANNFDWGVVSYTPVDGTITSLSGASMGKYNGTDIDYGYKANASGHDNFDSSGGGWSQMVSNPYIIGDASASAFDNNPSAEPSDWHHHVYGTYSYSAYALAPKTTQGQYLAIDQTWAWGPSKSSKQYEGQDTDAENTRIGAGFVRGHNYCTFRLVNFGELEAGDSSDDFDDTNTWEESGYEMSPQFVENYDLYKQLTRVGTNFRWSDDPSQTVYTISKVRNHQYVNNWASYSAENAWHLGFDTDLMTHTGIIDNQSKMRKPENYGYRIELELNKNIVWSPTSTIPTGQLFNEDGSHTTIKMQGSDQSGSNSRGTFSKIEILEFKASEITYTSDSPAVFEVEPRERADLNLYYETSDANIVLKSDMYIEALNNIDVNDGDSSGGNYNSIDDIGTIYKPGGEFALPYLHTGGAYDTSSPLARILTGPEWFSENNKIFINPYTFSNPAHELPGMYLKDYTFDLQSLSPGQEGHYWDLTNSRTNGYTIVSGSGEAQTRSNLNWTFQSGGYADSSYNNTSTSFFGASGYMCAYATKPIVRYSTYRVKYKISNWTTGNHLVELYTKSKHTASTTTNTGNGCFEQDVTVFSATGLDLKDKIVLKADYPDLIGDSDFSSPSGYWVNAGATTVSGSGLFLTGVPSSDNNSGSWLVIPAGNNYGVRQDDSKSFAATAGKKYLMRFKVYFPTGLISGNNDAAINNWVQGVLKNVSGSSNNMQNQGGSNYSGINISTKNAWVDVDLVFECQVTGDHRAMVTNGGNFANNGSVAFYVDEVYVSEFGESYDVDYVEVKQVFTEPALSLPKGITLRISKKDNFGHTEYFSDYICPRDIDPAGYSQDNGEIDLGFLPIHWHNCFAFGNGVESNRIRDDFNARTIDKGPRVSTTIKTSYEEEKKKSSLIYSGIYNGLTNTNKLNEFIQAEKITKDLNPEYGSIQKLFTRNTNVIAFCEDKILKILSNKDAIYNADGNPQLLASNRVLGDAMPFTGEYGMSTNPESFANYGYRVYFTDRNRGAVLRLSHDGLTPISDKGMKNYFKQKLALASSTFGSYNEDKDIYSLTIDDETISFTESTNGWTSFKSFLPEDGVSLNGTFYTFKNGDIWKHHSNAIRNNFYNTQHHSSIKFVFNDAPASIKNFNTLNYEGTTSRIYEKDLGQENLITTKGWYASSIESELQSGEVTSFKEKEGKWFNNITGIDTVEAEVDTKEFTAQGLGFGLNISSGGHPIYKTLKIQTVTPSALPEVNALKAKSAIYLSSATLEPSNSMLPNIPANTVYSEDVPNTTTGWEITSTNSVAFKSHHTTSPPTTENPNSYYLIDIIKNLVPGNRYLVSADVEFENFGSQVGFSHTNMRTVSPQKPLGSGRTLSPSQLNVTAGGVHKETISEEFEFDIKETISSPSINNDFTKGISIFKNHHSNGIIKNIQAYNITPAITTSKYVVNTSATDRKATNDVIKSNNVVDETVTVINNFYIHANTVTGIKQSVSSNDFTAVLPISSNRYETTLTDLGAAGYYNNVISVELKVYYNSSQGKFPLNGEDLKLIIEGTTNMAIDQ